MVIAMDMATGISIAIIIIITTQWLFLHIDTTTVIITRRKAIVIATLMGRIITRMIRIPMEFTLSLASNNKLVEINSHESIRNNFRLRSIC